MLLNPLLAALASLLLVAQQTTPQLVPQYQATNPFTYSVSFGGDGKWVAKGDKGRVRIFDIATGRMIREIEQTGGTMDGYGMLAFAAHPYDSMIAVTDGRGSVIAIDIASGNEVWRTSPGSPYTFAELHFSPDGKTLNTTFSTLGAGRGGISTSGVRQQWNAANGAAIGNAQTFDARRYLGAQSAFSADGAWFHTYRIEKGETRSRAYDVQTGRPIGIEVDGLISTSHSLARRVVVALTQEEQREATRTGKGLPALSGRDELLLNLVDIDNGRIVGSWGGLSAKFSSDGTKLFVAALKNPNWLLVDTRSGATLFEAPSFTPLSPGWALSNDAGSLATLQGDQLVIAGLANPIEYRIIGDAKGPLLTMDAATDANQSKRAAEVASSISFKPAAAFTSDHRWLVGRARDGNIDIWDTVTGNRMPFRLPAVQDPSTPLIVKELAQDGASGTAWRPVQVVSVASDQQRAESALAGGLQGCAALSGVSVEEWLKSGVDLSYPGCSISPDGRRIVVAGVEQSQLGKKTKPSTSLACRLAARCSSPLIVFDLAQRRIVARLRDRKNPKEEKLSFSAAAFTWSPDGNFLVQRIVEGGPNALAIFKPGAFDTSKLQLSSRVWNANSGDELDLPAMGLANGHSIGFVANSSRMLTQTGGIMPAGPRDIDIWDLQTRSRVGRVSNVPVDAVGDMDIASNNVVLIGPDSNTALWIRSASTDRILGHLRIMENGEWLVTTPDGLFDGSPEGWRSLAWRAEMGMEIGSGELFFNEFYKPGLLADLLAGRSPSAVRDVLQRDRRQPVIELSAEKSGSDNAIVRVKVREVSADARFPKGSGARDLRLFRNGVLVKAWRGDLKLDAAGTTEVEALIPLVPGENRIAAYVFNADNIKSTDATLSLTGASNEIEATVFVLAIGVNRYSNPEFNLTYAAPDATAFGAEFARQQYALGAANVRVVNLLDEHATRDNILLALARLSGAQDGPLPAGAPADLARLGRVRPVDTVVVYFAGHGTAYEERFHLIPADLKYTGPRAVPAASIGQLLQQSISDLDLERAFEPIDARHLLLIIDACNSGQAIESKDARFGPMNSRGLAQLAYEKGIFILTASQAYQAALESSQLGHGFLTFALVEEGLKTNVADIAPLDGDVRVGEWYEYAVRRVPQLQLAAIERAVKEGRDMSFGPRDNPQQNSLQVPRVFTRRDAATPDPVVAHPK